jgi:hypothetical protein
MRELARVARRIPVLRVLRASVVNLICNDPRVVDGGGGAEEAGL